MVFLDQISKINACHVELTVHCEKLFVSSNHKLQIINSTICSFSSSEWREGILLGHVKGRKKLRSPVPVSVASGERSFSKLSLIKNILKSTISQDRLNGLMLFSIEHKLRTLSTRLLEKKPEKESYKNCVNIKYIYP